MATPIAAEYDPPLARCPLCDHSDLSSLGQDYRGNGLSRCHGCGVLFVNPQYSDQHLQRFYAGYIAMHEPPSTTKLAHHVRPEVRRLAKSRALDWLAQHAQLSRILMVGCGDGLELGLAKERGWQPEGYDIDPATTAAVAARYGVPVHSGDAQGFERIPGGFDAVFMDQVIEHPKDPARYLRAVAKLLKPGGLLYLATPNIGSLSNRAKSLLDRVALPGRRRGKHYNTKHHLFFFTPRNMTRLLQSRFGFQVLKARASLKPQPNPVTALFGQWLPILDSSFALLARRCS